MDHSPFRVLPNKKVRLKNFDPSFIGDYTDKKVAQEKLQQDVEQLAAYQDVFYAQDRYSLLLVFQAMDAAGKDSTIKHVMSGVNPQGCQVTSFKAPSAEELDHDFLWRCAVRLPERGMFGIFNRSYYEEVLVVRVHSHILAGQKLPKVGKDIWQERFESINNFEQHLARNGYIILKFFLHASKEEQAKRFLDRINKPDKNWKFSSSDLKEREHFDAYMEAYEDALTHTSTEHAPWYVVPADHKWFTRMVVADIINSHLATLDLHYPELSDAQKAELGKAKDALEKEIKE